LIPPEAVSWLLGDRRLDVLLIGGRGGYISPLLQAGHAVTVIDPDIRTLVALRKRWPQAHVVSADTANLPFDPQCFSAVLSIQGFHLVDPLPTLREWARVLRAEGRVALAYFTRDDSVPWVKKLKTIINSRLPDAMRGDYGAESIRTVDESAYFPFLAS
jgi:SAM-dependent methyltransferase